ncbi:MAG: LptE family protein [Bacteroidales bacterium]|nr:LptE family protein [Bacteroidales bacterium]
MRKSAMVLMMITMALTLQQCKVTYSFSGVNISPEVQTYSVQYFHNRAPIVQAQLSQLFTDALMDKILGNTSLNLSTDGGDVDFSGEITNYATRPTAITGKETAARNRLTITVRVKYMNLLEPDLDYDTSFSRFEDYDASKNLSDVENELIELIVDNLIEDIFNRAFISW